MAFNKKEKVSFGSSTVDINGNQSISTHRITERYLKNTVNFYGNDWEMFFIQAFKNGLPSETPTFFIGSIIDATKKTVSICGDFSHRIFMEKQYNEALRGWDIIKTSKRNMKLPQAGDADELSFMINNKMPIEMM